MFWDLLKFTKFWDFLDLLSFEIFRIIKFWDFEIYEVLRFTKFSIILKEKIKEKVLVREFKRSPGSTRAAAGACVTNIVGGGRERSPGSTRAAAGVCVTNIVGGGCEKNHQRRKEEVLERRKF